MAIILGPCTLCPQELSNFPPTSPENSLLQSCLHLSEAFQKKSKEEFHLCRDPLQALGHSATVAPSTWKMAEGW